MNLVEELLKIDSKKADELETGIFKSKRLGKILETNEPVDVKIRALKARRINDIASYQYNSKGNIDISKTYDASLMACVEGCVEPNLMDKELQQHFACSSAKELAEKLFSLEVKELAAEISKLSGMQDDAEEEIKN